VTVDAQNRPELGPLSYVPATSVSVQ